MRWARQGLDGERRRRRRSEAVRGAAARGVSLLSHEEVLQHGLPVVRGPGGVLRGRPRRQQLLAVRVVVVVARLGGGERREGRHQRVPLGRAHGQGAGEEEG